MADQMQFPNLLGLKGNSTLQCLLEILVDESTFEFRDDVNLQKLANEAGVEITSEIILEVCRLSGPSLKKLNLSGCSGKLCLCKVAKFCGPTLQEIFLRNCYGITLIDLRALSIHCTELIAIDVSGCIHSVEDSALRIISSLHRLEIVELKDCMDVTDDGVCELAQCCKKLKYLGLMNCSRVGNRSCHAIGKYCVRLSELNLLGCAAVADAGAVSVLNGCRSLQILRNSNCHSLYGRWKKLKGKFILSHLSIVNCFKFNSFYQLCAFHELKKLDVSMCSSFSTSCLGNIVQNCKYLDDLNLSGCALVNDSMLRILSSSKRFIHINLAKCNGVTPIGVEFLIDSCVELTTLILTDCPSINHGFLRKVEPKMLFSDFSPSDRHFLPKPNADALRLNARKFKFEISMAILIQRMYRGWRIRDGIARRKRGAILLRNSVALVQASYRGQCQRRRWRVFLSRHNQRLAVVKIQSFWRRIVSGKRVFIELKTRNSRNAALQICAQRIQKLYRGNGGRDSARKLRVIATKNKKKKMKEMQTRYYCASIIQKLFRGYCSRKHFILSMDKISREHLLLLKREMSACMFQRVARGSAARKNVLNQRLEKKRRNAETLAATKVQSLFRGFRASSIAFAIKDKNRVAVATVAALHLQSRWREYKSRRLRENKRALRRLKKVNKSASVAIQRYWRGFNARVKLFQFRQEEDSKIYRHVSAVNIQRLFRGFKGRETRELARTILQAENNPENRKILDGLQICLADLKKVKTDISRNSKSFLLLDEERTNIENETGNMLISKSRYWDSDLIVKGVRQRYDAEKLEVLFNEKISDLSREILLINKKLESLKAKEREMERDCRKLRRDNASFRQKESEIFWSQRRQIRRNKLIMSSKRKTQRELACANCHIVAVLRKTTEKPLLLNIWTGEATRK